MSHLNTNRTMLTMHDICGAEKTFLTVQTWLKQNACNSLCGCLPKPFPEPRLHRLLVLNTPHTHANTRTPSLYRLFSRIDLSAIIHKQIPNVYDGFQRRIQAGTDKQKQQLNPDRDSQTDMQTLQKTHIHAHTHLQASL